MIKSGVDALNANANEIAAISRDCNDLSGRNARNLNEKNQLAAQCIKERMASLGINHCLVDHDGNWVQIRRIAIQTESLCFQRDGTTASEWIMQSWRLLRIK